MQNINIKTIVVLGMHRSGTSMIAGILSKLGAYMGEDLLPPNRGNPTGYFENLKFLELNKKILNQMDNTILPISSREEIISRTEKFDKEIKDVINKEERKIWGWKDPRTSLTIDLFLPHLKNPYFIICSRNPLDIARSLNRRDGLNINKGIEITKIYENRIKDFFIRNKGLNKILVNYDDIISNPNKEISYLIKNLKIYPSEKNIKLAVISVLVKQKKTAVKIKYILKKLFLNPKRTILDFVKRN